MLAVFKREMRSYFTGVIGYLFVVLYLAIAGVVLCYTTLFSNSADVSSYFMIMLIVSAIMLPLLTMKSFSEERKQKTEQLLMTAPVSITGIVLGKFLAAYVMFAACITLTSLYSLVLLIYSSFKVAILFGSLIATLLVGAVYIAIGIVVSSLTENQLAAAVITVVIIFAMIILDRANAYISVYAVRFVLSWICVLSRYNNFVSGILDYSDILYYLSITGVFLLLTVRVYDKRRWG
jgi:ABC-2 type transport system permease protein